MIFVGSQQNGTSVLFQDDVNGVVLTAAADDWQLQSVERINSWMAEDWTDTTPPPREAFVAAAAALRAHSPVRARTVSEGRSYHIPHDVQEAALYARATQPYTLLNTLLAHGGTLTLPQIRELNAKIQADKAKDQDLWGGRAARRWAARIVSRADAELQAITQGIIAAIDEEPIPEDAESEVPPEESEPDMDERHIFVPAFVNRYVCDVCGRFEGAPDDEKWHFTDEEISDQADAEPEEEPAPEPEPLAAGIGGLPDYTDTEDYAEQLRLQDQAQFGFLGLDIDNDGDVDYYLELDDLDPSLYRALFARVPASPISEPGIAPQHWFLWDPDAADWSPSGNPHNVSACDSATAADMATVQTLRSARGVDPALPGHELQPEEYELIRRAELDPDFNDSHLRAEQEIMEVNPPEEDEDSRLRDAEIEADLHPFPAGLTGLRAAGPPAAQQPLPAPPPGPPALLHPHPTVTPPEQYTPEERSRNASQQIRDRMGRFARGGSRVATADGGHGVISRINPDAQSVNVRLDSGREVEYPAKQVQREQGIGRARLSQPLPVLTPDQLHATLAAYEQLVIDTRAKQQATLAAAPPPAAPAAAGQPATPAPAAPAAAPAAPVSQTPDPFILNPDNTDVKPLFMAIVDEFDKSAVLELVALNPVSAASSRPVAYRRDKGQWVQDDKILRDLQGVTPPSVVVLQDDQAKSVISQIDTGNVHEAAAAIRTYGRQGELLSNPLYAAGGLDRNRGNAEELRRYWTTGRGGTLKIRWAQPGAWTRCYRHLAKYMGTRAKGYCQLRTLEMHGHYSGSREHRRGLAMDESQTNTLVAAAAARVLAAGYAQVTKPEAISPGSKFRIPMLVPEGMLTGDNRKFKPFSVTTRSLPLPLLWQIQTSDGHDNSVLVGRIDSIKRISGGLGEVQGVFDTGEWGREAERLVRAKMLRGVSADLDSVETEPLPDEDSTDENAGKEKQDDNPNPQQMQPDKILVSKARVMAATLVVKPAFQECTIELEEDTPVLADGTYLADRRTIASEALLACAVVASQIPVHPPARWFQNPHLPCASPLTTTNDGHLFGHIALWESDHIGMPLSTKPPRSASNYNYFHTGTLQTSDGSNVTVGQLTLTGGHAPLPLDAMAAIRHYDDTASAIADVHAGEDEYGIWVSGALRPGTTPEQIRVLKASAPSGDWRPINGRLELVAVCQVNVPGFPIAQAQVASGRIQALVAAGTATLTRMQADAAAEAAEVRASIDAAAATASALMPGLAELTDRIAALEAPQKQALLAKRAELAARVHFTDDGEEFFRDYSPETREEQARSGIAMKGGRYPIATIQDLKNAIHAYGRGNPSDKPAIKRHIKKRARALGRSELIPESWKLSAEGEQIEALQDRFQELAAQSNEEALFANYSAEEREEFSRKHWAMSDGSFPIANKADLIHAVRAYGRASTPNKPAIRRFITKRARSIGRYDLLPESWSLAAASPEELAAEKAYLQETFQQARASMTLDLGSTAAPMTEDEIEAAKEQLCPASPDDELAFRLSRKRKFREELHPRRDSGQFRDVLFRLRDNLAGEEDPDAIAIKAKIDEAAQAEQEGDADLAAELAKDVIKQAEDVANKTIRPDIASTLREGYTGLGEAVARMKLPTGEEATKLRFSDLQPELQELIENMLDKLQAQNPELYKEHAGPLLSYRAGGDYMSQQDILRELATILSLLI